LKTVRISNLVKYVHTSAARNIDVIREIILKGIVTKIVRGATSDVAPVMYICLIFNDTLTSVKSVNYVTDEK
jgi:hypothetical protein